MVETVGDPVWFYFQRHPPGDLQPGALQADDLISVVRQQAYPAQAEVPEYQGPEPVVSRIRRTARFLVRLEGVEALILKVVGLQFVQKPYAANFLLHVDENAFALLGDTLQRSFQLLPAITPQGIEGVTRQASGVNPYEHVVLALWLAHNERHVPAAKGDPVPEMVMPEMDGAVEKGAIP